MHLKNKTSWSDFVATVLANENERSNFILGGSEAVRKNEDKRVEVKDMNIDAIEINIKSE